MNSATKPLRFMAAWLCAAAALGLLAAGCADHGPTNVYSKTLFGQTQSGASMKFWSHEYTLSATAGTPDGVGPDQYVVSMENVGSGGLVGPVTVTVTAGTGCGALEAYSAAGTGYPASPLPTQVVTFGYTGQVIYPGDILQGLASTPALGGPYFYSFQAGFAATSGCSWT
ncbi:MAG: hypothetical protein ACREKE_00680, partial [bacterium]